MRTDFVQATEADIAELDRLAAEVRVSDRRRAVVYGLPIQSAFALVFTELAGKTGGR
jgi:hypothetical protein